MLTMLTEMQRRKPGECRSCVIASSGGLFHRLIVDLVPTRFDQFVGDVKKAYAQQLGASLLGIKDLAPIVAHTNAAVTERTCRRNHLSRSFSVQSTVLRNRYVSLLITPGMNRYIDLGVRLPNRPDDGHQRRDVDARRRVGRTALYAGRPSCAVADGPQHSQWPGPGTAGDPVFDQFYASQTRSLKSGAEMEMLNRHAVGALLDEIGPAIVQTHSQSGAYGWAIVDARPHLVRAPQRGSKLKYSRRLVGRGLYPWRDGLVDRRCGRP